MKKMIAFLATVIFGMSLVFSQNKSVVAVAPFDVIGVGDDDIETVTEVFISEYANTGLADVVDRNSFEKIRAQHEFQRSDWSNTEKIAELGRALNATQVVVGQFRKISNGKIQVIIRVEDVNSTKILGSITPRLDNILDALDQIPQWCKTLTEKVNGGKPVSAVKQKSSNIPAQPNPSAKSTTVSQKPAPQPPKEIRYKEVQVEKGWGLVKCFCFAGGIVTTVGGLAVGGLTDNWGAGCAISGAGLVATFLSAILIPNEHETERVPISHLDNANALQNLCVAFAQKEVSVSYTFHL